MKFKPGDRVSFLGFIQWRSYGGAHFTVQTIPAKATVVSYDEKLNGMVILRMNSGSECSVHERQCRRLINKRKRHLKERLEEATSLLQQLRYLPIGPAADDLISNFLKTIKAQTK